MSGNKRRPLTAGRRNESDRRIGSNVGGNNAIVNIPLPSGKMPIDI